MHRFLILLELAGFSALTGSAGVLGHVSFGLAGALFGSLFVGGCSAIWLANAYAPDVYEDEDA